ncbi:hypothetical protein [Nonlabens sp. Hel1_33_55]|uniref:hypothetical protein n=1 Tax=Nonlabens sp. Hel1_33_55 TaxID=1336802 RepID=UPI0012FD92BB|nr:hypothetical protein [Nonlabens sp. Hel1_33_55]
MKSIYLDGMELSQFRNIDFEQLQKSIDASDGVDKPMDVLEMYPHIVLESGPETMTTTKSYKSQFADSFLLYTREDLKDDSYKGIAIWMKYTTSFTGDFEIIELKESYLCYGDDERQEWSSEPCL